MAATVLIIQNITREGPGLLQEVLTEKNISYRIIDLEQEASLPDPREYQALVVLGGPDSAHDTTAKIQNEFKLVQTALEKNIPYLGICLGMQILIKASGGKIIPNQIREIGFRDPENNFFRIELTELGKKDLLFDELGDQFPVFHLHGETVGLTPDIQLLGTGNFCRHQIVRVGENAYGIQCHFELTPQMFAVWLQEDDWLQELDQEKLWADFQSLGQQYEQTGKTLMRNFLKIAGV